MKYILRESGFNGKYIKKSNETIVDFAVELCKCTRKVYAIFLNEGARTIRMCRIFPLGDEIMIISYRNE